MAHLFCRIGAMGMDMRLLFGAVRAALLATCLLAGTVHAQTQAAVETASTRLDSAARLLAGLAPTHPAHYGVAQLDVWKAHSEAVQGAWARMSKRQLAPMAAWRDALLPRACPVGRTLLYPFSGPDFINAYWLFPGCETFVLFGLEQIGAMPAVETLSARRLSNLLDDVRTATVDLFARNYFITDKMSKQLHTPELRGVVPLLAISMALSGVRVLGVEPFELERVAPAGGAAGAGEGLPAAAAPLRGVRISFLSPHDSVPRQLVYFRINVADSAIVKRPEFLDYLRSLGPTTTLLKSASYLLHGIEFRRLRAVLLDVSAFLVQDDTGLPYGMLLKRGWELDFYGRYEMPISPFEYAYQPELARAFGARQPQSLPFFFGYHRNRGDDRSHVMVARRPASQPPGSGANVPRRL
jgi:hypothetical protein